MYFQFFLKMLTVEIYTLLSCSYALLDVARLVAASSHLIGVCTTCALHSVPCWSAMSAHTCGSEYYCFLNGTHLPKTSWRKDLLTELKRQLSTICKSLHWTRHWNRYREEVYCGWPQLLPGNCLNNRNISFFFSFLFPTFADGLKNICLHCMSSLILQRKALMPAVRLICSFIALDALMLKEHTVSNPSSWCKPPPTASSAF